MASIADRWHTTERGSGRRVRSSRYGSGKRWQVRYRDPEGQSRNRSFDRKVDAERFLADLQHQLNRGAYVDERAGRVAVADFAAEWLDRQVMQPTTLAALELRLRVHILPEWGSWPLVKITPAAVQRWIRRLSDELSSSYVRLLLTNFGALLNAAVDDGLITRNPARAAGVKAPTQPTRRIRPWLVDRVLDVVDEVPEQYRALVVVAAGCGLRQGEAFGLRVQDIDFLRQELHVRQQIRLEAGRPVPALPKYGRVRSVPMPEWVGLELARHLERVSPLAGDRIESPSFAGLIFYSRERKPLNRNYFNQTVWRPCLRAAGVPNERDNGMHALRHACASLWLEHGVSIKAVSEYLGHADAGFTLRVYAHVMPTSGDKARKALDEAVGEGRRPSTATSSAGAPLAHDTVTESGQ
ncbi:tyrosine-type recombinase/integrase [Nocardioides mangrovi]|uniref:Site-specific integrase n=1 Tax=Nocardioides mangrovi TaxID=2874580 RepID=A0ABS7UIB2_9ACTN|nr:site-specific integrase [Nocardioides mangrovi]MBZ5740337.1 site-specific integrase [Nocardioides mangrovi]